MRLFPIKNRFRKCVLALCATLSASLASTFAWADIYVAPIGAVISASPDGSENAPFASLGDAIQARGNSETPIVLMDGRHPAIHLRKSNSPPLQIVSQTPSGAHVKSIRIDEKAKGTQVTGLGVWPEEPVNGHYILVSVRADDVVLDNLDLRGKANATEGYFNWSKEDWLHRWRVNGVVMRGANNVLTNSTVTATAFAIQAKGDGSVVVGNRVSGFSGDGMRGLGNHSLFKANYVENSFRVDANHNDGFQSWTTKQDKDGRSLLTDLVLDGNVIVEWTGPANHPLHSKLQGIGMFDGRFENITIQNNLIVVSQWHGIALYDGHNSKIVNNTVSYLGTTRVTDRPWIGLGSKREDPEAYETVLVANNAAIKYRRIKDALKNNVSVTYPFRFYTDPAKLDYTPRPGSPLIRAGAAEHAPSKDILGRPRASTGRVSAGAFEPQ